MKTFSVRIGDRRYQVVLNADGTVEVDGHPARMSVRRNAEFEYVVEDGKGMHVRVAALQENGEVFLQAGGHTVSAIVESERERLLKAFSPKGGASGGPREVRAPMPSLVIAVEVSAGQRVKSGQGLIILEAMKMENEIKANREGIVKSIHVQPGNAVEKGELLLDFET
jgi:biotin carboxyl carrier protein